MDLSDITTTPNASVRALPSLSHPSSFSGLSHQNLGVKDNLGEMPDRTLGKSRETPSFDENDP